MRAIGFVLSILLVLGLLFYGVLWFAGWWWEGRSVEVETAALRQVRETGEVVANVRTVYKISDVAIATEYVIFDPGAAKRQDALDKAADALQGKGWKVEGGTSPSQVDLESSEWDVSVSLVPLDFFVARGAFGEQEVLKVAENARAKAVQPEVLVVAIARASAN
ncbi:hypothetical protein ACFHYQ_18195 [Sphaerimonospora cavernae]|uniref:LytR cell envelope-related transcriptional attenuator n=1 Tax=Sphaerimonospora cavernae TaxID=1740611 RepID=A0ABV6U6Z9_9ACTN